MKTFHHTGDLGDIIASLPVVRELGGGRYIISDAQFPLGHGPRETLRGKRFEALRPISKATAYISEIVWEDKPIGITHDIASFRSLRWQPCENLTQWQGRYFNLNFPLDLAPWLELPSVENHDKIVVGRTLRYHTNFFPWRLIIDQYYKDIIFVGTPDEYLHFAGNTNKKIEYRHTKNLLEAAEIIAGSRLFIGGQSVLFWIAAGLGHPLIQETHEIWTRNSIVLRPNALYSDTNENLEKIYDTLKLDKAWLKRYPIPVPKINLSTSAQNIQKNLSTSAEIFTILTEEKREEQRLAAIQANFPSPSFG